ncbi:hypothetical protein [Shewanella sp. NIFS-20-20]|uniref:hypothetical protein n=1 Tax=Shewanella sp. NIFS-20-20 TaxID=2853806 RepID=UPI001C440D0F|nr:hypothetical protein [Shewanella sp. NIFS-20-20]MBV7316142.1 hypothetical protein [Shewanella sp. NIFS-20-20]
MKTPAIALSFIAALALPALASPNDAPWQLRYGVGIHDFMVNQVDSTTLGVNGYFSFGRQYGQLMRFQGNIHVYIDHDKDKLDPDHIPVWFTSDYHISGQWLQLTAQQSLNWQVELDGRRNTVSSVEKQLRLFPGVEWAYQDNGWRTELDLGLGYYFLEIDDDVPKERGYNRGDFGNDSLAYTGKIATQIPVNDSLSLTLSAQQWRNQDENLENQYKLKLIYQKPSSEPQKHRSNSIIFSIEHQQYNLDPYAKGDINAADYVAILPWDSDTMIRLSFEMPW